MLISSEYLANFAFSNSCCSAGGFRPARAAVLNFNALSQRPSGQPCQLARRAAIQMLRCGQRCPKNQVIGLDFNITWTPRLPATLCLPTATLAAAGATRRFRFRTRACKQVHVSVLGCLLLLQLPSGDGNTGGRDLSPSALTGRQRREAT